MNSHDSAVQPVWSRANVGEILPRALTPLTWSVFLPLLQSAGQVAALLPWTLHWNWKFPLNRAPQAPRLFDGHVYLDLSAVYQSFGGLPGVTPAILRRMLGFEVEWIASGDLPQKSPRGKVIDRLRAAFFWGEVLEKTRWIDLLGRWLCWRAAQHTKLDETALLRQPTSVLLGRAGRLSNQAARIFGVHLSCTNLLISAFGLLDARLRACLPEADVLAFEGALQSGSEEIKGVSHNAALWEIARQAQQQGVDPQRLASWELFLRRFGARGCNEFELAAPRWREDPHLPLQVVREMIAERTPNPHIASQERLRAWQVRTREILEQVRAHAGVSAMREARGLVATCQRLSVWRENLKYDLVRYFYGMRRIYLQIGARLAEGGQLPAPEDIFYLTREEIAELCRDANRFQSDTLQARRVQYAHHQTITPPALWPGGSSMQHAPALQGTAASPGVVTGRAYIYRDGCDASQIPAGSILVMTSMDPGLTVLFTRAAGLVTEIGGVLSHAAIVAREMGLPAVLGVPGALEQIACGQIITLDGFLGSILLESSNGNG